MTTYATSIAGLELKRGIEARYGTIIPLTVNIAREPDNEKLLASLMNKLAFSKEEDYLLVRGDSFVVATAVAMWLTMHRKVNLIFIEDKSGLPIAVEYNRDDVRLGIEQIRDRLEATKEVQQ